MEGPLLAVQLGLLVLVYGWVVIGLPDRGGTSPWWFMSAIAVLAVAVVSPLDGAAQRSLTATWFSTSSSSPSSPRSSRPHTRWRPHSPA